MKKVGHGPIEVISLFFMSRGHYRNVIGGSFRRQRVDGRGRVHHGGAALLFALAPTSDPIMTADNNDTSQIDDQKKKKLFYTTSDMLKTINKSIASLDGPPDDPISPRVELQRRMPDGSTRRATDQDLKAADMDSKLKQVLLAVTTSMQCIFTRILHFCSNSLTTSLLGCRTSR